MNESRKLLFPFHPGHLLDGQYPSIQAFSRTALVRATDTTTGDMA
jgi:hypothetical protein